MRGASTMAKNQTDIGTFFGGLPKFRLAPPNPKSLPQAEKARRLGAAILKRLYEDGTCLIDDLEADAPTLGISGRVRVTLGAGVGGKGGLQVFCDGGHVVLIKDN